ncbi:hypothetical protein PR202_ga22005 [Eleusine coracana subsp. coracana]|uniref:Major facilitator superfamily (MFS) profile domain-containing protein n=1 Tax=Eleusine coracana subsp. coracana TaxID=191504 RepID=A0AAV5D2I1_ELECO|nr:hypothetical protein PR202_ga22005 [Eleusine coracana subsp. coracana]
MAPDLVDGRHNKDRRKYGRRITMFVALSCITAAMGGAIFGYDLGTSCIFDFLEQQEFFPDVYRRMKGDVRVSNYCKLAGSS